MSTLGCPIVTPCCLAYSNPCSSRLYATPLCPTGSRVVVNAVRTVDHVTPILVDSSTTVRKTSGREVSCVSWDKHGQPWNSRAAAHTAHAAQCLHHPRPVQFAHRHTSGPACATSTALASGLPRAPHAEGRQGREREHLYSDGHAPGRRRGACTCRPVPDRRSLRRSCLCRRSRAAPPSTGSRPASRGRCCCRAKPPARSGRWVGGWVWVGRWVGR